MAVPEGTIKRRLYDARQQIRKGMKEMQEQTTPGRMSYAPAMVNLWGGYQLPNYRSGLQRS
ncbi:MAG TPA: hypothetical protein GXX29_01665 [Firmicutes bacterium]|nr:hypothetical protein [Bacillota bacterium]